MLRSREEAEASLAELAEPFYLMPARAWERYNDKQRDGSVTIQPGKSLRFKYRVVIHPGDTASINLQQMYDEYKKSR